MFDADELKACIERIKDANAKAKEKAKGATALEKALVDAIQARVPKSLDDVHFKSCNEAYAEAMVRMCDRKAGASLLTCSAYARHLCIKSTPKILTWLPSMQTRS